TVLRFVQSTHETIHQLSQERLTGWYVLRHKQLTSTMPPRHMKQQSKSIIVSYFQSLYTPFPVIRPQLSSVQWCYVGSKQGTVMMQPYILNHLNPFPLTNLYAIPHNDNTKTEIS